MPDMCLLGGTAAVALYEHLEGDHAESFGIEALLPIFSNYLDIPQEIRSRLHIFTV
jgi:hypothetical protein